MPAGIEYAVSGLASNPILSGLAILVIYTLLQDFFLFRRLRRLVRGGDGKSLEGTIRKLDERVQSLESMAVKMSSEVAAMDARVSRSVQAVSVIRFDPFQNASGQQSFASALVSEKGNGVVLSGIHARDGVRVYAKPVRSFQSVRELSEEERDAIDEARSELA